MPTFQKKPLKVVANQWHPGKLIPGVMLCTHPEAPNFVENENGQKIIFRCKNSFYYIAVCKTIHGLRIVRDGDWLIKESDGEHWYPVKQEIFQRTYEEVKEES